MKTRYILKELGEKENKRVVEINSHISKELEKKALWGCFDVKENKFTIHYDDYMRELPDWYARKS